MRVPLTIGILFHFILGVIFSSFNFHMSLESPLLLMYFLRCKSLACFLKWSLNAASALPKYFWSVLLGYHTTALCINLKTQKSWDPNFDVLIGYYNGSEIWKLLAIFILNKLNSILINIALFYSLMTVLTCLTIYVSHK